MFDYTQVAWKQVVADFQKVLYIMQHTRYQPGVARVAEWQTR